MQRQMARRLEDTPSWFKTSNEADNYVLFLSNLHNSVKYFEA